MSAKLLIVEDQEGPLEALEDAVNKVLPEFFLDFSRGSYDVAKWYDRALGLICENEYRIVLLDHRMPCAYPGCTDKNDFDRFKKTLENMGYLLIRDIKMINPKAVVIGTSSLSKSDLREFPAPDFKMSKMWGEAERDLRKILEEVRLGGKLK